MPGHHIKPTTVPPPPSTCGFDDRNEKTELRLGEQQRNAYSMAIISAVHGLSICAISGQLIGC